MGSNRGINIERQVLLFEIERRCIFADCNERVFISLTKQEATKFDGFECRACERWNSDTLSKKDIPDWWEDIRVNQED